MDAHRRGWLKLALFGTVATLLPACRDASVGWRFPEMPLPWLDGRAGRFMPPAGGAMVVNFWASWCEPCRREMPSLERLSRLFHPEELMIVGVSVDSDINLAREFGLRHGLTFPMLSDADQRFNKGELGISALPMTYLLKRDHTVARVVAGGRDWAEPAMVGEIESLLAVRRDVAGRSAASAAV